MNAESNLKRTYWCDICHVPLLKTKCLACGSQGRDIAAANLVPVFKPELAYLAAIFTAQGYEFKFVEYEVWVQPSRTTYFIQGKPAFKLNTKDSSISLTVFFDTLQPLNRSSQQTYELLKSANSQYVLELQFEATHFIRDTLAQYKDKNFFVSFSGGKDSTVVSNLVMSALGRSDVLHIFSDTTIEFPDTYEYIKHFKSKHPHTPFVQCSSHLDFFELAKEIGAPSRILRWCCTTHKTNPIALLIKSIAPKATILAFDGVRHAESARRAKYLRITKDHKIANEILISPIIFWTDIEIWIYLLFYNINFNKAYRHGFRRVGCLYCPYNSTWSIKVANRIYQKEVKNWHTLLQNQATLVSKYDNEIYIEKGWKARAGGRGLDSYKTVLESSPCVLSDTAISYQILNGELKYLQHYLSPLGKISQVFANSKMNTFFIIDPLTEKLLASVEIDFLAYSVRINYLLKEHQKIFRRHVEKQLKKMQACFFCGACAAQCPTKALNSTNIFNVDTKKCIYCLKCVQHNCPVIESLKLKGQNSGKI